MPRLNFVVNDKWYRTIVWHTADTGVKLSLNLRPTLCAFPPRKTYMRMLIADDHRLLRDGIRSILCEMSEWAQISAASTLDEAISVADLGKGFDMALLGHTMSGMDGVEGVRVFLGKFPQTKVVLLTGTADSGTVLTAVAAGAHGVLSKGMSGHGMRHALRLVLVGETYLPSDAIISLAISDIQRPPNSLSSVPVCRNVRFSPSETEVIPLLLDGLPNKLIAQRLNINEAAAKARLRGVYKKVGAANRAQAVWGLLALGEARSA